MKTLRQLLIALTLFTSLMTVAQNDSKQQTAASNEEQSIDTSKPTNFYSFVEVLEGLQAAVEEATIDVLENQEVAGSLPMNAKGMQAEPVQGPTGPQGPNPMPQMPVDMNQINTT